MNRKRYFCYKWMTTPIWNLECFDFGVLSIVMDFLGEGTLKILKLKST